MQDLQRLVHPCTVGSNCIFNLCELCLLKSKIVAIWAVLNSLAHLVELSMNLWLIIENDHNDAMVERIVSPSRQLLENSVQGLGEILGVSASRHCWDSNRQPSFSLLSMPARWQVFAVDGGGDWKGFDQFDLRPPPSDAVSYYS